MTKAGCPSPTKRSPSLISRVIFSPECFQNQIAQFAHRPMTAACAQNKVRSALDLGIRVCYRDSPSSHFKTRQVIEIVADKNNARCIYIFFFDQLPECLAF